MNKNDFISLMYELHSWFVVLNGSYLKIGDNDQGNIIENASEQFHYIHAIAHKDGAS